MIKKFSCVLILSWAFSNGYSQPFQSVFGDSATSWNVTDESADAIFTDSVYVTDSSFFNNHKYMNIHSTRGRSAYLREDTAVGKVWYCSKKYKEYLVMDLSLNLGDTFHVNLYAFEKPENAIVDSVYFTNGKKHIRFDFELSIYGKSENMMFIEGVGSNAGILYQDLDTRGYFLGYLLCHYKDGVPTYSNAIFNGKCYIHEVGINEPPTNNYLVTVSPNPFSQSTVIKFDGFNEPGLSFFLYDVTGRLVREVTSIKNKEILLEREALKNGLYFFYLRGEKGKCYNGKLVVE